MLAPEPDRTHDMFIDRDVMTADGHRAGTAGKVIVNAVTLVPEWLVVESGLLGRDHHIVPIAGSDISDKVIVLACKREAIESARTASATANSRPAQRMPSTAITAWERSANYHRNAHQNSAQAGVDTIAAVPYFT